MYVQLFFLAISTLSRIQFQKHANDIEQSASNLKTDRTGTSWHSPLLAPDFSAVRERLQGSLKLQRERETNAAQTDSDGSPAALSVSDNVRTDTAIVQDRLEAEVAAEREGQECYSEPYTLMTAK